MSTLEEILKSIHSIAPVETAMSFDNVGLLVGEGSKTVNRALICLDVCENTVQEAAAIKAELIIAHHPVIFHPISSVFADSVVYSLIKRGIAAIGCHTNLDLCADWGVNTALARALGIEDFKPAAGLPVFTGKLKRPIYANALAMNIANTLGSAAMKFAGENRLISNIALCSGAGGEYIYSIDNSVDALITGEARHDEFLEAWRRGICLFAAGHYESEKPFAPLLAEYLQQNHKDVSFTVSKREQNPVEALIMGKR